MIRQPWWYVMYIYIYTPKGIDNERGAHFPHGLYHHHKSLVRLIPAYIDFNCTAKGSLVGIGIQLNNSLLSLIHSHDEIKIFDVDWVSTILSACIINSAATELCDVCDSISNHYCYLVTATMAEYDLLRYGFDTYNLKFLNICVSIILTTAKLHGITAE